MADTGTRRIHFYLLVIASVLATSTAGTVISCQITPSDDSEYETLTCIFAVNVGRLGKSFALYQDFGNARKERKVSCNFFNGRPLCEVTDGFQAPETVTDRAVMLVPKTRNATFICERIPPEEGVKSCVLDVGTPQPTLPPIPNEGSGNTGTVISCQITPSDDSEYEHLTCIFAVNVGRFGKSFALYQDFGNARKERKVSCNVFNGKPLCEVTDGFQAPETVTERAVFLVPKTRNATFICDTIPREEGVKSCVLDVGTPQATQPPIPNEGSGNTGWRDWHTGVVGAVLTATVVISAVVCLIRRKRSRERASEPKQKDKTDNEESAESENLNQPSQDAEQEFLAVITSAGASGEVDGSPDWCECGLCHQMPKENERLCCRMNPCLSTSQPFKEKVLERAMAWEPQVLLHNDVNETKRKQAYTWFTEWKHGHLSKGVKTPVYSCCVWAIRDLMPDKNGKYTGFVKGIMICFETEDFNARWGKHMT